MDGQPSPYTQQAMEFCNNFEQERQRIDDLLTRETFTSLRSISDVVERIRG